MNFRQQRTSSLLGAGVVAGGAAGVSAFSFRQQFINLINIK